MPSEQSIKQCNETTRARGSNKSVEESLSLAARWSLHQRSPNVCVRATHGATERRLLCDASFFGSSLSRSIFRPNPHIERRSIERSLMGHAFCRCELRDLSRSAPAACLSMTQPLVSILLSRPLPLRSVTNVWDKDNNDDYLQGVKENPHQTDRGDCVLILRTLRAQRN